MILHLKDGTTLNIQAVPDDFDALALMYGEQLLRSVGVAGVTATLTRLANRNIVAAGVSADDDVKRAAVARYLEAWRPKPAAGGPLNRLLASVSARRIAAAGSAARVDAVRRFAEEMGVTVRVMGVADGVAGATASADAVDAVDAAHGKGA